MYNLCTYCTIFPIAVQTRHCSTKINKIKKCFNPKTRELKLVDFREMGSSWRTKIFCKFSAICVYYRRFAILRCLSLLSLRQMSLFVEQGFIWYMNRMNPCAHVYVPLWSRACRKQAWNKLITKVNRKIIIFSNCKRKQKP